MSAQPLDNPPQEAVLQADVPVRARVLLAVSGGADSIALLDAVLQVIRAGHRGWEVAAAHINHGLRGDQSDQDEMFVRSQAETAGVPFLRASVATAAHARAHHLSLETAARELRYAALFDLLQEWDGDVVMTGHTADDQAETVLLHLLRGSGLRGLGGMRARSRRIVRPFLAIRRETILSSLQESGRGYRVDASNADTHYTRNWLRREIMPRLDLQQPQLVAVLARTAALLQVDADFISDQTQGALRAMDVRRACGAVTASRAVWRALHPALAHAVLRMLIDQLLGDTIDFGQEHISALAGAIEAADRGPKGHFPRGLTVSVESDRIVLRTKAPGTLVPLRTKPVEVPGVTPSEAGTLYAELLDADMESVQGLLAVCGPFHALCDSAGIEGELTIGSRKRGDRMIPLGSPGTRKLQDIFVDLKIPRALRARVSVIRDETKIVWIPGIAIDSRIAVTPATSRILHLRWEPDAAEERDRMHG